MIQTYEVSRGGGRVFEFKIKGPSGYRDLSTLAACSVVVDDAAGADIYTAQCPPHATDSTVRLVTITGTATATAAVRNGCVHWTDAAGISDAERFRLLVYDHA